MSGIALILIGLGVALDLYSLNGLRQEFLGQRGHSGTLVVPWLLYTGAGLLLGLPKPQLVIWMAASAGFHLACQLGYPLLRRRRS
jgi:hypothetical protein